MPLPILVSILSPSPHQATPRSQCPSFLVMTCAIISLLSWLAAPSAAALIFTVNSTADLGDAATGSGSCATGRVVVISSFPFPTTFAPECTLRAAIEEANADPTGDVIEFGSNLTTVGGVIEIQPATALPSITSRITIDGYSHPAYDDAGPDAIPVITLLGLGTPAGTHGLELLTGADNSIVQGLSVAGFPGSGIRLASLSGSSEGPTYVTIAGNHLGVRRGIFFTSGNGGDGLLIESAEQALIGQRCGFSPSSCEGKRNLISANGRHGIYLDGFSNAIGGNYIGVDRTGMDTSVPFGGSTPNNGYGVFVAVGAQNNKIGLAETSTAPDGSQSLLTPSGNLISGNGQGGVKIEGRTNSVRANMIGLNATGTAALANQGPGVEVFDEFTSVGGSAFSAQGNVISGNIGSGILVQGDGLSVPQGIRITNNLVGLNATGDAPIGNNGHGISLEGIDHFVERNTIGGNAVNGIFDASSGSVHLDNHIGTNVSGQDLGNAQVGIELIGGARRVGDPGLGNTVGFNEIGISTSLQSSGIEFFGNFVGTNAAGQDLANRTDGILLRGADHDIGGFDGRINGVGNTVGHNMNSGIVDLSTGTRIRGNYIGTNAAGADLGNGERGILTNRDTQIGGGLGTPTIDIGRVGNEIAFNPTGIAIVSSQSVTARGNLFFANGTPSIDLDNDGPTPNDPTDSDVGSNGLQNAPEFNLANTFYNVDTGDLEIALRVDSTTENAAYPLTIDFYRQDAWLAPGDQVAAFLGSVSYSAPLAGLTQFFTLTPEAGSFPPNAYGFFYGLLRATVTDANGRTSELSREEIPVPEPGTTMPLAIGICVLSLLSRCSRAGEGHNPADSGAPGAGR